MSHSTPLLLCVCTHATTIEVRRREGIQVLRRARRQLQHRVCEVQREIIGRKKHRWQTAMVSRDLTGSTPASPAKASGKRLSSLFTRWCPLFATIPYANQANQQSKGTFGSPLNGRYCVSKCFSTDLWNPNFPTLHITVFSQNWTQKQTSSPAPQRMH